MKYRPLSCASDDTLFDAMLRRRPVNFVFSDPDLTIQATIKDITTTPEAEFVVLEDGSQHRLDLIKSIDGVVVTFQESCAR